MPARYHPVLDGVWSHEAFGAYRGLPRAEFEEISFFVFLCTNTRLRPSGIYRATDEQLAIDSRRSVDQVHTDLGSLERRRRIVRDGDWIFIRGYFSRQSHGDRLLSGVKDDLIACSSGKILKAFYQKYPGFMSTDGLVKVTRRSGDHVRNSRPKSEQSSTEQSTSEQYTSDVAPATESIDPGPKVVGNLLMAELDRIQSRHPELGGA